MLAAIGLLAMAYATTTGVLPGDTCTTAGGWSTSKGPTILPKKKRETFYHLERGKVAEVGGRRLVVGCLTAAVFCADPSHSELIAQPTSPFTVWLCEV
jgi:hypothetical protein